MTRDAGLGPLLATAQRLAADYLASHDEHPVFPSPGALAGLAAFDEPLPEGPAEPLAVLHALDRHGSPATVRTTGGRYFGFVSGGVLPAALAANWLAGAWDQNAGFWAMSPVASRLEEVVGAWLLELLDLPRDSAVGFVTGSTMASFSALLAARAAIHARRGYDIAALGARGAPPLKVVASAQIHPANLRALRYLGVGRADVGLVATDEQGRLIPSELPPLDAGTIVLAQAGNVNTGSFDPFTELCDRAHDAGAWVHVDGAFGLWARASPTKNHLTRGVERADSWNLDGHKWLNVPMDSGVYGCRHPAAVARAFGVEAPYMVRSNHREPNYFTPELGRRARGVEIWAALKSLGRRGVADLVERSCAHASTFAERLRDLGFVVLNDVCLNQVLFALPDARSTARVLEAVQQRGEAWIGPTEWLGRPAARISCCSWAMDEHDVHVTVENLRIALAHVRSAP